MENTTYPLFSKLVSYPETGLRFETEALKLDLSKYPEDMEKIGKFLGFIQRAQLPDIEELFTRTFDLNAACCLEIGWHLYGEDYRRGEFLVRMRQSLAEENLPETGELPDHLSHCLLFLDKLEKADAHEFAKSYVLPALGKILEGFQEKEANPYQNVLEVLKSVLQKDFEIHDNDLPHPALRVLNNARELYTNHEINNAFPA